MVISVSNSSSQSISRWTGHANWLTELQAIFPGFSGVLDCNQNSVITDTHSVAKLHLWNLFECNQSLVSYWMSLACKRLSTFHWNSDFLVKSKSEELICMRNFAPKAMWPANWIRLLFCNYMKWTIGSVVCSGHDVDIGRNDFQANWPSKTWGVCSFRSKITSLDLHIDHCLRAVFIRPLWRLLILHLVFR